MTHDCLILGATGFIGGQIARAAVAAGWRVRALRRRPDATGDIRDLSIEWAQADLGDRDALLAVFRDWTSAVADPASRVLFYCAGAYPHNPRTMVRDVESAVRQMRNVLGAAAEIGVGRLVYTSSYTTIGPPDVGPSDVAQPAGLRRLADERDIYVFGSSGDPYYEAKWAMEVEALQAAQTGLPVVVLCPSAVFGPGDVHMSVSGPLLMAARGRLPFYFDAPLAAIDVRDVASAHIAAAERGRVGERYILSGPNGTLYAVLSEIAAAANVRPPRIKIGARLLKAAAAIGQLAPGGEASFLKTIPLWQPLSNAKARHDLGLTTRPLSETMADTFAWFRARGVL